MNTFNSKQQSTLMAFNFVIPFIFCTIVIVPLVFAQNHQYRTPGAKKTLVFEPAEFDVGPNFAGAKAVSDTQHYRPYREYRQVNAPNPTPDNDISSSKE